MVVLREGSWRGGTRRAMLVKVGDGRLWRLGGVGQRDRRRVGGMCCCRVEDCWLGCEGLGAQLHLHGRSTVCSCCCSTSCCCWR